MNTQTLIFNTIWQHLMISGLLVFILMSIFKWFKFNAEIRSWVWFSAILALMIAPVFLVMLNTTLENNHSDLVALTSKSTSNLNIAPNINVSSTSYFNNPIQLIIHDPTIGDTHNSNPTWLIHTTNITLWTMPYLITFFIIVSAFKLIFLMTQCVIEYQIKSRATDKIRDNIYYSNDVYVPSLVGLIHCKILLPLRIESLSEQNQHFIIAHEQAHFKRQDQITSFVIRLIDCFFWFSPLFYVMNNQLKHVREIACDQRAIKQINNNHPTQEESIEIDYANMLIDSVKLFLVDKQTGRFMNLISRKGFFRSRINEVADKNNDSHTKNLILSIVSCCVLLVSTCVFANNALNNNEMVQSIDDIVQDENIKQDMIIINEFINRMNQLN